MSIISAKASLCIRANAKDVSIADPLFPFLACTGPHLLFSRIVLASGDWAAMAHAFDGQGAFIIGIMLVLLSEAAVQLD